MADRRNDIDSWFNAYDEGDSPAMPVGDGRSPDDAASERNIADEVGQPPQSVRAYPELFSQSAEASRTRRATQGTPRLQRWISEPENYAVARDDVESLSVFERVLRPSNSGDAAYLDWMALASPLAPFLGAAHLYANRDRVGAGIDPRPHFRLGQLDEEHTQLAFRDRQAEAGLGEPLTDEERARLDELATMPGRDDWGPFIIGPTARLAPQIIGQFRRGVEQGGAGWEESVTDVYGDERARSAIARRVLDGDVGEGARAAILAPIAGVGGAIAGVGGAIGGYLEYGYEMETGGAFDEMVRSGVDRSVAAERSAEYGRWAMALEFVGDALFLPVSGATRFATRTLLGERLLQGGIERAVTRAGGNALRGGGTQGLEETSQELAQIIHQDIAQQETEGASADILQAWRNALTPENIERMLQAGYIGMQGGVGMASIPAGANLALDMRAIRQAERAAGVFEQQTQAAQSSRLNERGLTSTLESAVGAMDSSNVYIDADRFIEHFQSAGANAYAVAEELGIGSDALAEAASSHGQVEIPTARFAARVLRIPQHASLAEHARIAPDADTPAEAKAAEARLQAQIERIAEEVETLSAEQDLGQEVEARVRDLFARAQTEGGPRADVAARYAKLPAALAQALVARARQTDPAYAQKLEGELRAFFTERFGIAGPARDVAASGAELNQRGDGARGSEQFNPPPEAKLTERERKVAEMAINNYSNREISDEMEIFPNNVSVALNKAAKKLAAVGVDIPWSAGARGAPAGIVSQTGEQTVTLEQIGALYEKLVASGYSARGRGSEISKIIAARFGLTRDNVNKRLQQWRAKQKRNPQTVEEHRRTQPFDLNTPEGRADWFEREVLAEPIPGEASDARQYGFALDTGEIIVMSIAPEPTGSATVEWTFLDRLKEQAANPDKEVDLFGPGKEKIGVRGVLALMARVAAVMEADMAEFRRDSYVYTPNNDALENIYKALVNRILEGGATYATIDDGAGTAYIVRDGAKVSRNGTVIASPENANAEPIQWPQLDPEAVRALQNESYERIERFAKEGSPEGAASDGGREGGAGTGDDAGGGVSGTGRRDRGGRGGGEDLSQSDTRGSIRYADFDAGAFGEATIRLGQASDLSTFLHEFGHLGHLVLESIATDPDAPVEFKDMWGATLDWWGLDQEAWNGLSAEQRVPYFEQWARTFEAYLLEGRAPSLSLREVFAAFKQWLLQVYRTVLRLNANLTPEIRSVFDRLLASDAEMAEARAAMGADFKLSREAFKTDEEFQAYVHAIAEAKEAQEADLRALAMDAYARKSKRWWRGERERMRDAATRYVDSDPARRAHDWIAFEQWRDLPSTELSDEGEIGYAGPDNAIEEKPEGLPPMRLASQAIEADWSGIELPAGLKPRVHADEVLAEAMSLKAQDKGRGALRAQRLGQFVRKNKGVQDPDGVIRDAIGSGRKRPGLINANGITPEHMMGRAAAAGYFGPAAAKLYLNEQQAQEAAASIIAARKAGARRSLTSFVRSQGGIKDDRGDVAGSAGDGQRGFARLIRPDGKPIDQLIEAAHAAGHFPDIGPDALPSAREFIDALDAESRGLGQVEAEARAAQMNLRYWQRLGFDTSLPEAELVSALHGAANPSARPMAELAQGNDGGPSPSGGERLNWLGHDRLIRNPSEEDLARLAELGDEMKYVMDADNNVYAFSAADSHHNIVMRALRDNGATVRPLGSGAEITDPDAAGFIWRNRDGTFSHEDANMVESGTYADFAQRMRSEALISEQERARFEAGELFQTDSGKAPSLEEFLATLIADLTGERSVYSSSDKSALAQAQDMEDARAWFEVHDIDLSADKDTIRAQIEAALEADRTSENQWHPDDAAQWFGFSSGDELIQALSALKPRSEAIEERIDQMVEEEHGDAFSPDKVKDAARKAAHAEAQARRIELELSALQAATGGKKTPVSNAARAYAEKRVQLMTVRQIRNYETFLAGERRAARNAMEAKQPADAAMWKQKQLISFHLYRFARDAATEMDRAQNYFQKFDRDTIRAKIHAPLLDQIDQALEGIDLRASPRISDRRRQSFNAWYAEMQSEGLEHMVVADPDFLEAVRQRPFNALTLEEARAIRDAVKNFEHIGRRWREVLGARDARLLDEAVAEMTASMATVKPFEFANTTDHSPGIVESLDVARQGFHAQLSRVEFVARAMDGMKDNGPVWNGLFRPLTEARDREEIRQEQAQGDIENLFSVYSAGERADMWTKRKFYPQVPSRDGSRMGRNFTKQEILAIALNTGNEYNFGALIAGDNWTETQVRALLDAAMDGRDWAFVQSAWDYADSFWPEIEALYLKTAGVAPPKVQPTPFQNQYGEWRGGYWHLEYDYGRDQRVRDEVEHGQIQNAFGGFRLRTQTPNGFSKTRQGSGGRPVKLDLAILSEHVNEVIHDLEFRAPVLNAWRLMKHHGFREAFVQAAGQRQYDQLKPWLQYVATEIMPPERGFSGVIKLLRRNTPIALMGYALSTVSQQPAGIMGTFARVGTGRVMGKLAQLSAQPWTWGEHARFINSRSTLMRNRTRISQREIREMVQEINDQAHIDAVNLLVAGTPGQKAQALAYVTKLMQRYALFPLAFLDKWISSAAWKAAYDKAIGGYVTGVDAQNEADAVAYADLIIRTTFGSGRPEDLPPVMRSTEIGKLITPAFSYFSTQYNQLYNEQTPGMMRGQISPLEFATFITFTLVLQALVSEWAAGRWEPDDDESEEERNIRLGVAVAQAPLAGVPLVRDMTRSALQAATTGQTFGSTVPAFGAIGSTGAGIGRAAYDLADEGQISRAAARDLTMAAGYWFGLPSRQMWTTGSYLSDVAAGEEDALWDTDEPLDTWSEAFLRDTR